MKRIWMMIGMMAGLLGYASATTIDNGRPILLCDTTIAKGKPIHQLGVEVSPAYVLPAHSFFRGNNLSGKPIHANFSAHLKYGFRFAPDSYFGKLYPHATQGIGVAYNTFFNQQEMGSPVALYVFQTSRIASLSKDLSLDYEWNFGASFGWKKYDEETNHMNQIVGSKINAYINLGILLNWRFAPRWRMTAGVGMTHFSNGNTHYPNYGVNTVGVRLGLIRTFDVEPRQHVAPDLGFDRYVSYDVIVYGASRKKGIYLGDNSTGLMVPGTFGIIGMNFNPMYNVSRYFRTGLSLDMQYDESANIADHVVDPSAPQEDLRFYRPSFKEQFGVGISARAELVMPIFSINIGIGKNFICKGADTNKFYQIIALKTHVTKRAFLHVGYQLYNFKDPNNLMLGVGYRFGK